MAGTNPSGAPRFRLLSDDDGHDYLIPVGQGDAFYKWVESAESDPDWYEQIGCSPACVSFTDPRID